MVYLNESTSSLLCLRVTRAPGFWVWCATREPYNSQPTDHLLHTLNMQIYKHVYQQQLQLQRVP